MFWACSPSPSKRIGSQLRLLSPSVFDLLTGFQLKNIALINSFELDFVMASQFLLVKLELKHRFFLMPSTRFREEPKEQTGLKLSA
ncbi:hypothetical protein [Synechococcus sp. M16CYN]|uniref:hypothetical protein n=1 Tax=Synechococcus sp. M16CYN TaxID=3103139 RepID=UPI003340C332